MDLPIFQTSPVKSNKYLTYRPDIDGLRALAVLAVIAYHVDPTSLSGGFVGVDIFFVISGFLISSIIYSELRQERFSITEFYIRRIRRIYPALLAVLLSVAIAGWFISLPSSYALLGRQIAGGSAFVANFVLWSQAGYLDGGGELKPLLHLWSLGIEEQYYLIFPVICLVFYRLPSRWALLLVFVFMTVASMTANVVLTNVDRNAAFYLPFTRLWELFLGAGLSLCQHHNEKHHRALQLNVPLNSIIGAIGSALILYSMFCISPTDAFPGWLAALPCIGAALLISSGPESLINRLVFSSRPAVFIGLISYPLYLWHWPILSFAKIVYDPALSPPLLWAVVIASIALAVLTYYFIEKPVCRLGSGGRRKMVALSLLGGVSLVGVFGVAIVLANGVPNRFSAEVQALDHDFDLGAAYRDGTCFLRSNQTPDAFADACLGPANGSSSAPLMLIWGDSHAADLYPGFRAMQGTTAIRLAQYTASLCPPLIGLDMSERPFCRALNDSIPKRIMAAKPDIVVLSAYWASIPARSEGDRSVSRAKMFEDTIRTLKTIGVPKVVVIGPAPFWRKNVPDLLIDALRRNPGSKVPLTLPRTLLVDYDDAGLRAVSERSGATYVSLMSSLCDDAGCVVASGQDWRDITTYDQAHFTEHGSFVVAQKIWGAILDHPK